LLDGEIGRLLGCRPQIVLLDLTPSSAGGISLRDRPLVGSSSASTGLRFLEGALSYDRLLEPPDAERLRGSSGSTPTSPT
jgi:hypothetical protein